MNLCKDVCSIIRSEATAYFLLDLYFSNASLARIVVVRDREIGKKCKLVVLYLIYAFLESLEIIMKLGVGGDSPWIAPAPIKCIAVVKILLFHDPLCTANQKQRMRLLKINLLATEDTLKTDEKMYWVSNLGKVKTIVRAGFLVMGV